MNKIQRSLDFHAVNVFLQAARDENLTATARNLYMSPSAVSKAIARLEKELDVRLLNRSPRSVTLTPEGSRFYVEAERLTVAVERTRNAVRSPDAERKTRLKVVLPLHFGRVMVCPRLPLFLARHPTVTLSYMLYNNGQVDVGRENFDLGIFMGGESHDSTTDYCFEHVAQREMVLCAAPAYVEQFGQPESLTDLDSHQILGGFDEDDAHEIIPWRVNYKGREIRHQPRFCMISNSIEVLTANAESGVGVALLPDYVARDSLQHGKLVRLLANYHFKPMNAEIFYKRDRIHDAGVESLLELLRDSIQQRQSRSPSTR